MTNHLAKATVLVHGKRAVRQCWVELNDAKWFALDVEERKRILVALSGFPRAAPFASHAQGSLSDVTCATTPWRD